MNIYLLQQNAVRGWGTYDSCVVVADNEIEAAKIPPWGKNDWGDSWARSPDQVRVLKIGTADDDQEAGDVICASFNAG